MYFQFYNNKTSVIIVVNKTRNIFILKPNIANITKETSKVHIDILKAIDLSCLLYKPKDT